MPEGYTRVPHDDEQKRGRERPSDRRRDASPERQRCLPLHILYVFRILINTNTFLIVQCPTPYLSAAPNDGLLLAFRGASYPSTFNPQQQSLNVSLICDTAAPPADPQFTAYDGATASVEWRSAAGCARSPNSGGDKPKNEDEKNGGGGGDDGGGKGEREQILGNMNPALTSHKQTDYSAYGM